METKISLAIIVKDVEKTLDRCLESFKPCVDEIILVDTGSSDNTIEIAKKYTDKIFHFDWIDDFSAARNYSFGQCTGDYILWVDGDDYILPEDVEKFKAYNFSDYEMITCPYVYAHDEYDNPQLITARERVIKRSLNLKWVEPIHEYLPMDGLNIGISEIHTHHNKQHGTSERNLAILERIVEKESNSRNLYYLAREYADFGRTDEAIERFEDYLGLGGGFWENVFQAHYKLANCYLVKGEEAKFKEHIFKAIDLEDRTAEPFYFLGLFYMNKKLYHKAIPWYEHCLKIERPKELLSSYLPMYYTWLPHLNLCYCYNCIGKFDKAYEHNKNVLKYRPHDIKALENNRILQEIVDRKDPLKDGQGKKLHLGCGGKRIDGYVNVDLFDGSKVDEVFEFDVIPYKDNTISAIYSEHALEHVPFARAERALKEWHRVLKPGGKVTLYIPDFEECCKAYLNAPLESQRFMETRAWYKLTIYGVQESQGGEPDEAQIHMCGFSKAEIRIVMERNGFIVDSVENYGGPGQKPSYGTPSMAIMARKAGGSEPDSKLKIGWIADDNWVAAQTRIRVLKVNDWLNSSEYDSSLTTFQGIVDEGYDIAIIGKKFNEEFYNGVKMLKEKGIPVYCDLCESILQFAYVPEILELCDKVICCSRVLAEEVKPFNPNVVVIEDAYETE